MVTVKARARQAPRPAQPTLSQLLELFSSYYRAHNYSVHTIPWYQERLGWFFRWFEEHEARPPTLDDFSVQNVMLFILTKQNTPAWSGHPFHPGRESGPSPAYIHSFYRAVQGFSSWPCGRRRARSTSLTSSSRLSPRTRDRARRSSRPAPGCVPRSRCPRLARRPATQTPRPET